MTWTSAGSRYRLAMSTEPNLWRILKAPITDDGEIHEVNAGFVVTYVDNLLAVGPHEVVAGALACVRGKWECSPEEWVNDTAWTKFCGMELRWEDSQLLIGQPSYARELVNRHREVRRLLRWIQRSSASSGCMGSVRQGLNLQQRSITIRWTSYGVHNRVCPADIQEHDQLPGTQFEGPWKHGDPSTIQCRRCLDGSVPTTKEALPLPAALA